MAAPSLTYTLTNATTANANHVQQNFQDLLDALTDELKDLTVNQVSCATQVLTDTIDEKTGSAGITFNAVIKADIIEESTALAGVSFGSVIKVDNIEDKTDSTGVTIEGVLLKGSEVGVGASGDPFHRLHLGSSSDSSNYIVMSNGASFNHAYIGKEGSGSDSLLVFGHSSLNDSLSTDHTLMIHSGGKVGIGVSPTSNNILQVASAVDGIGTASFIHSDDDTGVTTFSNTNASYAGVNPIVLTHCNRTSSSLFKHISSYSGVFGSTASEMFRVQGDGVIYAQNTSVQAISSDARLKNNIQDHEPILGDINKLKVRKWEWKDTGREDAGLIAQEVSQVFPRSLKSMEAGDGEKKHTGPIKYTYEMNWNPVFIKCIQELSELIEALDTRLTAIENNP